MFKTALFFSSMFFGWPASAADLTVSVPQDDCVPELHRGYIDVPLWSLVEIPPIAISFLAPIPGVLLAHRTFSYDVPELDTGIACVTGDIFAGVGAPNSSFVYPLFRGMERGFGGESGSLFLGYGTALGGPGGGNGGASGGAGGGYGGAGDDLPLFPTSYVNFIGLDTSPDVPDQVILIGPSPPNSLIPVAVASLPPTGYLFLGALLTLGLWSTLRRSAVRQSAR